MRITCDACEAKYSIADDKVSGKVFKIRCKKCSHVIVVRGSAPAAAPPPEPVAPVADDAIWYLVIDQEQIGPLTVADVARRFAAGEIDRDTFAWHEGLADWEPLARVAELAAVVAPPAAAHDDVARDEAARADLFAPASAPRRTTDDVVTARAGRDAFGDGAEVIAAAPASARLRGERNESSVLFSLNNLAQIANRAPAPAATTTTATGATGGEGSGLIDIRSMASAYLGTGGVASAAAGKPASTIGSLDDLPVFGGGGFSEPAVLVPTARPAASGKLLYLMIGAMALFAAVAIVLVVMLLKTRHADAPPAPVVAQVEPAPAPPPPAATVPAAPASPPASPPAAPATTDHAAPVVAPSHAAPAASPPAHASSPAHHATTAPATHATPPAAHASPAPATATEGDCDKVTCAFNGNEGACCAKYRAATPASHATATATINSDLPESLDVAKIQAGIGTVKAHAQSCGDRSPAKGKVKVHFKVSGDGRVTNVSVESSPDAALGACVQSAAQKASFVKTQRGGSFNYTFVF